MFRSTGSRRLPTYHPEQPAEPLDLRVRAGAGESALRCPRRHRGPRRRGLLLRDQAALRPRARHRLRADGGQHGRHRGQQLGGQGRVLFTDSADKAARFIWLCDAYSIPLIYLADVPGFTIGSEVERGGIIRHGAKMVRRCPRRRCRSSVSSSARPMALGSDAMGGPGFGPDATIALPTARIAVMRVLSGGECGVRQQDRRRSRPPKVPRPETTSSLLDGRSTSRTSTSSARRRPGHRPGRRGRPAARRAAPEAAVCRGSGPSLRDQAPRHTTGGEGSLRPPRPLLTNSELGMPGVGPRLLLTNSDLSVCRGRRPTAPSDQ